MQVKYGEGPGNDGTCISQQQLERFYAKHDASMLQQPGRIEQLLQAPTADLVGALKQKYGESPIPEMPGASSGATGLV